ncbi:MAG: MscL family protein, partial [Alphaproteobacteria bacterium]
FGLFVNALIAFIIVAFALFIVVKGINKLKRQEEEKPKSPPAPPAQEVLLGEIRDLLKAGAKS